MPFVDLKAQYRRLRREIDAGIAGVLDHGRFIMGPEVGELERALAKFAGVRHCISVSDGTTALLIALMALGVSPGDEVVTTPFSFIATAETICLLGATPVFVDIDPQTCNLDPAGLERAIGPRTRAIMPVSLYGQCADMDAINEIAGRHGLPVIEDAAQSFGATYRGRRSTALSTIGCTSFFPSKPLGCYGDGGACFTDDDRLAAAIGQIRLHGQSRRYVHVRLGLNGRLDTLQAAILLVKLRYLPAELQMRRAAAMRYSALIGAACASAVRPVSIRPYNESAFGQYTVRIAQRDRVAADLAALGVPTAVHYPICLHRQPLFADYSLAERYFSNAETAAAEVLSLPMYPDIEPDSQARIVAALAAAVG
ncbi:MAG: DegT/DnrJ/EryC1/StrS family aminotransferase [Lautropia sp.]